MNINLPITKVWQPGAHILVALSGGADSVALLLLLAECRQAHSLRLSAAHFEHGIRGEEAMRDARFAQALCDELSVPLTIEHGDIPALAKARGVGLEQAARDERYAFLKRVRRAIKADYIALGHHADDQAETILMHLLRGAGLQGASGMRAVDGQLIRPLLSVTKAELLNYLKERGQTYVTDRTNFEPDTPRNALRLLVMPELSRIYPGAISALCRHGEIAGEENALLNEYAAKWLSKNATHLPMGVRVSAEDSAPDALVRRALHDLLPNLDYSAMKRLMALYRARSGKISLGNGATAERVNRSLYLLNASASAAPAEAVPFRDGAALPGLCTLRITDVAPTIIRDNPYRQVMNPKPFERGAVLRTRRPGDRFRPLGAPGDRLLSDVLIDRKVDRPVRDYLPLVAVESRVLWVPGIGIAHEARIEPDHKIALCVAYEGTEILAYN